MLKLLVLILVTTNSVLATDTCPRQAEYFNGYCYEYLLCLKTFHSASVGCQALNSTIISIHSLGELNFVTDFITRMYQAHGGYKLNNIIYVHIGLTSKPSFIRPVWTDGTLYDFQLSPSMSLGTLRLGMPDLCGSLASSSNSKLPIDKVWLRDDTCDRSFTYVCKYPNSKDSTTTSTPTSKDSTTTPMPSIATVEDGLQITKKTSPYNTINIVMLSIFFFIQTLIL